ncbi:hypothetical protein D3C75_456430 [compost metagenome]
MVRQIRNIGVHGVIPVVRHIDRSSRFTRQGIHIPYFHRLDRYIVVAPDLQAQGVVSAYVDAGCQLFLIIGKGFNNRTVEENMQLQVLSVQIHVSALDAVHAHIRINAALGPVHIERPIRLVIVNQRFLLAVIGAPHFETELLGFTRINFHHDLQHVAFDIVDQLIGGSQIFVREINHLISPETLQFLNGLNTQFIMLIQA